VEEALGGQLFWEKIYGSCTSTKISSEIDFLRLWKFWAGGGNTKNCDSWDVFEMLFSGRVVELVYT
jgi:hypothetical protein